MRGLPRMKVPFTAVTNSPEQTALPLTPLKKFTDFAVDLFSL